MSIISVYHMASTVSNINMTMNTTRCVVDDREEISDLSEVTFLPRFQRTQVSEKKVIEIELSDEDEIDEVIILNQRSRPRCQWTLPLSVDDYSDDDEIDEVILPEKPRTRQVSENIPDYSSDDVEENILDSNEDDSASFSTVNYTKSTIFVRGDSKEKLLNWIDGIERRVAMILSAE
jgi:hypothetical protein